MLGSTVISATSGGCLVAAQPCLAPRRLFPPSLETLFLLLWALSGFSRAGFVPSSFFMVAAQSQRWAHRPSRAEGKERAALGCPAPSQAPPSLPLPGVHTAFLFREQDLSGKSLECMLGPGSACPHNL